MSVVDVGLWAWVGHGEFVTKDYISVSPRRPRFMQHLLGLVWAFGLLKTRSNPRFFQARSDGIGFYLYGQTAIDNSLCSEFTGCRLCR